MDLSLVTSVFRSKYPHWVIVHFLFIKYLQNSSYVSLFLLPKSFTNLSSCFLWIPLYSGICDYSSPSAPVITKNTVLTMWTGPLWSSYYSFSTIWCFNFLFLLSHSFIIFFLPAYSVTYLKLSFWFCLCCFLFSFSSILFFMPCDLLDLAKVLGKSTAQLPFLNSSLQIPAWWKGTCTTCNVLPTLWSLSSFVLSFKFFPVRISLSINELWRTVYTYYFLQCSFQLRQIWPDV